MRMPRFRNASSRRRFARMFQTYSVVSVKMVGSGWNVTVVPRSDTGCSGCSFTAVLPRSNRISYAMPSRWISTVIQVERAFTQETPTPWRPPDTL